MKKKGIKRLSILGGVLGAMASFMYAVENSQADTVGEALLGLFIIMLIGFLIPFFLIRLIGWVIEGFSEK